MDFGDNFTDSALNGYFTAPTVLGHEVVAEVAELGPRVSQLEVGQRVVLNPWLSCGPRGSTPRVARAAKATSACVGTSPRAPRPGIHTGLEGCPGGSLNICRPMSRCCLPFPTPSATRSQCWPTLLRFLCTRHPASTPTWGKVLVYGGGALGTTATAILRALYPDVEVMVVARFPAQAALARRLGAAVVDPYPRERLIEEAAAWSEACSSGSRGLPGHGAPRRNRRRL